MLSSARETKAALPLPSLPHLSELQESMLGRTSRVTTTSLWSAAAARRSEERKEGRKEGRKEEL